MATYGANVLTGGTASASTEFSGSYVAAYACDGNAGTRWGTTNGSLPGWWRYDLGAGVTKKVEKFGFYLASAEATRDFTFSGSNDGTTWTVLYRGVGADTTSWQYFTFNNATAYRYYQIDVLNNYSGSVASITEIQAYELTDATGVVLSDWQFLYGGTASASSEYPGGYEASKASDLNLGTRWGSNLTTSGWWKYDLGAGNARVLNRFDFLGYGSYSPNAFIVEGSNDNSSWNTLLTTNGANSSSWQTFAVTNSTAYRYYRMSVSTTWGSDLISIWEFLFWESETYTPATITLTPSPVAITFVIPVPSVGAPAIPITPDPVVIPLVIPAPTLTFLFKRLRQPFYLGSVYATLSQPFDLLAPAFTRSLHQLFDLTGPLGAALSQPFALIADLVGTSLHQLFDLLAAGTGAGEPRAVPPVWRPMMVFDKAGLYLGSIAAFNVTTPPVRYLRSRRVTNEGGMTFNVPRSSPDIGLIASDRLVRLQSLAGEEPWWGTMSPQVSAGGIQEVECADGYTLLRDGPAIVLTEEVGDGTPATGVYARLMAIHNDLRAATGETQWELDLQGSRVYHGDIDLDTDTMSALDETIKRSRTEIAVDSRLEGNRLVPILRVRDRFDAGAGAAIFDGPDGNVVAGVQVIEDPTPLVFSIRLRGTTTDLAKCLPEWAQWALQDITPEVTVSVDPGAYRNRQRLDESLDWGLSKAAVAAQCNAIIDWIWGMYRSFLRAIHDIEGRPWHEGWAYLGPPDIYEPQSAGRDSLSRRAWRTRLQLVETYPDVPASAVMISDKHQTLDLREWLIVRYDRVTGVQTVECVAIPSVLGLSLVKWHNYGVVMLFTVSGGRITSRRSIAAGDGAYVDPYSVRVWDPVEGVYRNLRRIISGPLALTTYINPGDADNRLTDLGPDAAIDQAAGDGSSLIAKVYDFEGDKIDDYDPRRDGIGLLKAQRTIFNGAETWRPRWHIISFDTGADATTSLTVGISATDQDFEVDSIMGFPDPVAEAGAFPFTATIGDGSDREIVLVLSMTGALWHVLRGQNGTEAIIHEAGAPVGREGAETWPGFPFPYTWPEGEQWAADELAELSKPRIDLGVHVAHFRDDQLTIDYGSLHPVNVATEGASGRWVGSGRAIGWSTDPGHNPSADDPTPPGGETEVVVEWTQ